MTDVKRYWVKSEHLESVRYPCFNWKQVVDASDYAALSKKYQEVFDKYVLSEESWANKAAALRQQLANSDKMLLIAQDQAIHYMKERDELKQQLKQAQTRQCSCREEYLEREVLDPLCLVHKEHNIVLENIVLQARVRELEKVCRAVYIEDYQCVVGENGTLVINCNDVFAPGADAEEVPPDKLDEVLAIIEGTPPDTKDAAVRYDRLMAWVGKQRGQEPFAWRKR